MFIDTEIERKNGIGKKYKYQKLQPHECLVSAIMMQNLNLKIGQKVAFDVPYVVHLKLFIQKFLEIDEGEDEKPYLIDPFYTRLKIN
jgi:hypothetical protein